MYKANKRESEEYKHDRRISWVLEMREKGHSPKAIGRELNLTPGEIRQLEKEGKKIKKRGGKEWKSA